MSFDSPGAVLRLEVRPAGGARSARSDEIELGLARTRQLLETPAPGRSWTADAGPGVSGTVRLVDAADAFPLLHRWRTEIRSDPSRAPLHLVAGLGAGNPVDGSRRAVEAFRALNRKRSLLTEARIGEPDGDVVLGALCRTLDAWLGGWTRAQWQAVHRRDQGRTLQEIGQELGIAYQNVSKRLIAARYSLYREVLEAAGLVFSKGAAGRL